MSSGKGHAESPLSQQRLEHLNAVLRAIRSVNQLIVHEKDPDALIRRACSLLVETRGCYSAWIALLDGEGNLRTAAESGLGDAFQTMVERVQRGEFTSCGLRALAERGVRVIEAPVQECEDCPLSHSYEGRSGMTVRLEHGGMTYGLMSVSVPAEYAQDDEEALLLEEVAGDIAYAVHNLAVEDAHNRAVEALRESEEKFRSLLEQSRAAIAVVAPAGRLLDVNQSWLNLFGYTREELAHLTVQDTYVDPDDREDFLRRIATTGFVEDEVRFKKKDGTVMNCQRTVVARKDEHGHTVVYQALVLDITERRKNELALRDSEKKFRSVFERSRDAIALVEPSGRLIDVNQAWLDLYGYSRDEVQGLNVAETYANPEEREAFLRKVDETEFIENEVRFKKKDGTIMDCLRTTVAQRDDRGNVVAYQGMVRDITEQKRAQEELRSSEERYRLVADNTLDVIWSMGLDLVFTYVNPSVYQMLGYTPEEWVGSSLADHCSAEHLQQMMDLIGHALANLQVDAKVRFETVMRHKNGDSLPVEIHSKIVVDGCGRPVGLQGTTSDIAERKQAEQVLKDSEEKFRSLFEQSPEAAALTEPSGRMLDVNQAWLDLFGYARDEIPGLNGVGTYVSPEDRVDFLRKMAEAGHVEDETRLKKKDGTAFMCERIVVARKDEHGNVVAFQSLIRDLTERRRMELEVRRQREHFKALFANSPEGVVSFDIKGAVVDVNSAFERLFGYRREDMLGRKVDDLIVPKGLEKEAREATRRTLRGSVSIPETTRRRADGSTIPVSLLGAGIILDGKRTGGFGIYRDMTDYRKAQDRLQDSFIDLVETMTRSMESLDPYTSGHQRRVARLADLVGRELGMDDDRLQGLYIGALLHDIGKLSVPSTILTKPGRLTGHEWNIIRAHPRRGYDILKEANLPWPVAGMALGHHERLDGSGYPDGVKGPQLSLEVRILGVCDVVEAMSSDRPYRPARPVQEVIEELRSGSGQRYDPQVVEAALRVVESGAFPLRANGADTDGDEPGGEKRPSYTGPVAGEGATLMQRTAETAGSAPGSDPSGGTHLEEQPAEELLNLAETLSRAMASRDPTMTNHQRRVADFVVQVGTRLGLPAERLWGLRLGGLLHDVGKIAVPEFILTRPGRLSKEELELVRTHPETGYEILRDAGLPPVVPLLALHHHERLDGSGYPHGLTGDSLSMEDRILGVCNIVEAMGAHRPYRRGLEKREVIAEIVAGRGTRYEPAVVDCVLELIESGEFVLGE